MVFVGAEGLRTDAALARWVRRGLAFVTQVPVSETKRRARKR